MTGLRISLHIFLAFLALIIPPKVFPQQDDPELERMGTEWVSRMEQGNTEWALNLAKRMLVVAEKRYHPKDVWVGLALNFIGQVHVQTKNYEEAETMLSRSLVILQGNRRYRDTSRVEQTLKMLGRTNYEMRRYERAKLLIRQHLELQEKTRGTEHPDLVESLFHLFLINRDMGDYEEAKNQIRRMLKIHVQTLGPEREEVATDLDWLADICRLQEQYKTEVHIRERAWRVREKVFGEENIRVTSNLLPLANACLRLGQLDQAEAHIQRSITIRAAFHEADYADLSKDWASLGDVYLARNNRAQAEKYYTKALQLQEQVWGPVHPEISIYLKKLLTFYEDLDRETEARVFRQRIASIDPHRSPLANKDPDQLMKQGDLVYTRAKLPEAVALFEHVCGLLESQHGPEHPGLIQPMLKLVTVYLQQEAYTKAEVVLLRALKLNEQAPVPDDLLSESIFVHLTTCCQMLNKPEEGLEVFNHLRSLIEKRLGEDHEELGQFIVLQAKKHHGAGQYAEAERLYQQGCDILLKKLGEDHPQVDDCLHTMAIMYRQQGVFERAGPALDRLLAIREKTLGPGHPKVAECLDQIMYLLRSMGRYEDAMAAAKRSLGIWVKTGGPESRQTGRLLNELSFLSAELGEMVQAEQYAWGALKINEKNEGRDGMSVAISLSHLGEIHYRRAHYKDAEPLFKRALAIAEKRLAPEQMTGYLGSLGRLYRDQRRYAKAEAFFRRILAVDEKAFGADHVNLVESLNLLGDTYQIQGNTSQSVAIYERWLEIVTKAYGAEHPALLPVLDRLANVYQDLHPYRAGELTTQAKTIRSSPR
jgi:tetratricopeptide (TPR) repeat protein